MIYRTKIPAGGKRHLAMANVHDYAQVFVDGALIGTLDRRRGQREIDLPECAKEATLEILVEAMGHINFTIAMDSDRKGLYGEVKLGEFALKNWEMLPLPLKDDWIGGLSKTTPAAGRPGGIFKGRFALDTVADTFLDMSQVEEGRGLGQRAQPGPLLVDRSAAATILPRALVEEGREYGCRVGPRTDRAADRWMGNRTGIKAAISRGTRLCRKRGRVPCPTPGVGMSVLPPRNRGVGGDNRSGLRRFRRGPAMLGAYPTSHADASVGHGTRRGTRLSCLEFYDGHDLAVLVPPPPRSSLLAMFILTLVGLLCHFGAIPCRRRDKLLPCSAARCL